jgi:hypothetical protein
MLAVWPIAREGIRLFCQSILTLLFHSIGDDSESSSSSRSAKLDVGRRVVALGMLPLAVVLLRLLLHGQAFRLAPEEHLAGEP